MKILGSIIGDVCGSTYENPNSHKTYNNLNDIDLFRNGSRFTDDTVLTVATMDYLINEKPDSGGLINPEIVGNYYKKWFNKYPNAGFGSSFKKWAAGEDAQPSIGNGAAMRVGPIAHYFNSQKSVCNGAEKTAMCSHNTLMGIEGARAVALTMLLVKEKKDDNRIKDEIERTHYKINQIEDVRKDYFFSSQAIETVPVALAAYFESISYEHALKLAISVGGDSDTIAAIAGGIAAMKWEIDSKLILFALNRLTIEQLTVIQKFNDLYGCGSSIDINLRGNQYED